MSQISLHNIRPYLEIVAPDFADLPRELYIEAVHAAARVYQAQCAAVLAEREACAKMLDDLAREAGTARDNYRALGNAEHDAQRHDARASAYAAGADAIRARGATYGSDDFAERMHAKSPHLFD